MGLLLTLIVAGVVVVYVVPFVFGLICAAFIGTLEIIGEIVQDVKERGL